MESPIHLFMIRVNNTNVQWLLWYGHQIWHLALSPTTSHWTLLWPFSSVIPRCRDADEIQMSTACRGTVCQWTKTNQRVICGEGREKNTHQRSKGQKWIPKVKDKTWNPGRILSCPFNLRNLNTQRVTSFTEFIFWFASSPKRLGSALISFSLCDLLVY